MATLMLTASHHSGTMRMIRRTRNSLAPAASWVKVCAEATMTMPLMTKKIGTPTPPALQTGTLLSTRSW